jgi:hypothetical protein
VTKSFITLIGALVSIAIVVLAVVFGVLPLVGQAFTALGSTVQAGVTNSTYEAQIANLKKEKDRKGEIDASVAALRGQIPATADLDAAFDVIANSAVSVGGVVTSSTRGDLAPYTPRVAPVQAGPAAAEQEKATPSPAPTPQPTAGDVVGDAQNTAAQANANANQTSQAANGTPSTPAPAPAAQSGAGREQIPISVSVNVPDLNAAVGFLDGLRNANRLLAVDKATASNVNGGLTVTVDLLAFVAPSTPAGASK